MKPNPTVRNWVTVVLISLCVTVGAVARNHDLRDLKSTTLGRLDDAVTENRQTSYGVETNKTYDLTYTFDVDGKHFQGSDWLREAPQSKDQQVFFDPSDPEINALRRHAVDTRVSGLWLTLFIIAVFAYSWLPTSPRDLPIDDQPKDAGVIGDSAGEFLAMGHGNHSGYLCVELAFFVQIGAVTYILTHIALLLTAGKANIDVVTLGAVILALTSTFFVYWDRWVCIETYCSRYCSGCVNISILYLPFVALIYANYRGLLKLSGR